MTKKKMAALAAGGVVMVAGVAAAAVVATMSIMSGDKEGDASGNSLGGTFTIEEGNFQQIQDEMTELVQEGYFETYMNTEWTFENGTAETKDAVLGNSPSNSKPVRYEVVLEDTGEVVYSTPVLPVGALLPPFKLDVDLKAGEYEAVCKAYLMKEVGDGTYEDFGSAGFSVKIKVLN